MLANIANKYHIKRRQNGFAKPCKNSKMGK